MFRAMCEGYLAIDGVERSHAHMRLDLRSDGRSKSFPASANRTLCQQAAASYKRLTGADPALVRRGAIGDAAHVLVGGAHASSSSGGPGGGSKRLGGNPFMSFLNHKMATAKKVHARQRALSAEERSRVQAAAKEEWETLPQDQKTAWGAIWRGECASRRVAAQGRELVAAQAGPLPKVWGCDCEPGLCRQRRCVASTRQWLPSIAESSPTTTPRSS